MPNRKKTESQAFQRESRESSPHLSLTDQAPTEDEILELLELSPADLRNIRSYEKDQSELNEELENELSLVGSVQPAGASD